MAAHASHAHAKTVNDQSPGFAHGRKPQDFVRFSAAFPLFAGLTVTEILVNPGNQRPGQGGAERLLREIGL